MELGLLHGDPEQLIAQGDHERFCPHKTSHWLGLDVHDVGDYRLGDSWRDLTWHGAYCRARYLHSSR